MPAPDKINVLRGSVQLLGNTENFFEVNPPALPIGWGIAAGIGNVSRVAEVFIDRGKKTAKINLDSDIFENPELPEGCKIFMFFHEIGHLIHGPDEAACDEFAFWHALRVGVTPFLCFFALAAYMPDHYAYRVEKLGNIILSNPQLKKYTDGF